MTSLCGKLVLSHKYWTGRLGDAVNQVYFKPKNVLNLLFWNLGKNQAAITHLDCLIRNHQVNLVLLAEYPRNLRSAGTSNLDFINAEITKNGKAFRHVNNIEGKVAAFTSLPENDIVHRLASVGEDLSIWTIERPLPIIIGGVHLIGKSGGASEATQALAVKEIVEQFDLFEEERGHSTSILVGDFNMHPYDPGMTNDLAIPGYMTVELASRPDRKFRERPRRRFYNPMWGLFGDRTPGPAGSYYWRSSVTNNTYWTLFDQILIRAPLIEKLKDVVILDSDGSHSLVNHHGMPDVEHLSDHLPLLASFHF